MAKPSHFQTTAEAVTDRKPAMLDWGVVSTAYKGFSAEYGLTKQQDCPFVLFALETTLSLDIDDAKAAVTDGGQDRGIDAVVLDRDNSAVHLFQCKETKKFKPSDCNFPSTEVDKVLSFISDLLSGQLMKNHTCNSLLQQKVDEIWETMQETTLDFHIHFFSNGTGLSHPDKRRFLDNLTAYNGRVHLREHTLSNIATLIPSQASIATEHSLRFVEDQLYFRADANIRGISCTVKLDALVDFLRDLSDPHLINENLFRENFRLYLGKGNRNNSRIQNSATTRNNHEFWYLNNGITITCKQFDYQPKSSTPVRMTDPQIVNGCQTAHAIFEAKDSSEYAFDGASVSVKIVETTDLKLVDRVAEATNSQTTIKTRDLRANDLVQIKLETSLEKSGYFYERKKNQHKGQKQSLRIDALKVGQTMLAFYNRDPTKAKTLSNEIFGDLFRTVFDPSKIDADKVITAHLLYEEVLKRRNQAAQKMKQVNGNIYSESWMIEGTYHLLFVVGALCKRDNEDLGDLQVALNRVEEAIQIISEFMRQNTKAAAYRIFRSTSTRDQLSALIQPRQLTLGLDTEQSKRPSR